MKQLLVLSLLTALAWEASAQQFSFQLNFIDAVGNKDSLLIGYDPNGTIGIDPAFGEVNLVGTPLNPDFDVRISDEWYNTTFLGSSATYQTKKQIIPTACSSGFSPFEVQNIGIKALHWPVTASWDNSAFNDACRAGSVFTSINPGGWWDTGSPSNLYRQELAVNSSATFSPNQNGVVNSYYAYVNSAGDTISVFWLAFGDQSLLTLSASELQHEKEQLKVFPVPVTDQLWVKAPANFLSWNKASVYSSTGQLVLQSSFSGPINVSKLAAGLYSLIITNEEGHLLRSTFIKR